MVENSNEDNQKWGKACSVEGLRAGWHMATYDLKGDFIAVPFEKEQYAFRLDNNLKELSKKLQNNDFVHLPTLKVPIPKGVLGTRPGSYIPLESRIVLFSIVRLVAKEIDRHVSLGVYSCRVKKDEPSEQLFDKSGIAQAPFLKRVTVDKDVSPFEPWYEGWLEFNQAYLDRLREEGYSFLAVSDISAYFENIHLELLRDLLQKHIHDEQKIINFIISAFTVWTPKSPSGQQLMRGLPQGSDVSRFFGNCFLMPVDEVMSQLDGVEYYRYMDDVRIFSKSLASARLAILKFDNENRKLHLNLQSAKTKILDDKYKEIESVFVDERMDSSEEIEKEIARLGGGEKLKKDETEAFIKRLDKIMRKKPKHLKSGERAIIASGYQRPLTGLTERLFRRIITSYINLKSREFLPRLLNELKITQDSRFYERLVRVSKRFPSSSSIVSALSPMLKDTSGDVRDYQKGQILRAFRYQSRLTDESLEECIGLAEDTSRTSFLRVEALLLVARLKITKTTFRRVTDIYQSEGDVCVRRAAVLVLIRQRGKDLNKFIDGLRGHANSDLKTFGDYLLASTCKKEQIEIVEKRLFDLEEFPYLLADYYPIVQMVLEKADAETKKKIFRRLQKDKIHKRHPILDIRDLLEREIKRYNHSQSQP